MTRLLDLPVDGLKIDRRIAAAVVDDPRAAAIVVSTTDLAHALGLAVTAEGVEDVQVLDHLRAAGCDLAQGWLFSPAVKATVLPDLLRRLAGGTGDRLAMHRQRRAPGPHPSGDPPSSRARSALS